MTPKPMPLLTKPTPPAPPRTSLMRRAAVAPMPTPPQQDTDEEIPVLTAMSPDRATRIDSAEMDTPTEPTEESLPEWAEGFTAEEVEKITQYASEDDIKKALLHAQRKLGEQGSKTAGLEQMVKDQLAAVQKPVAPASPAPEPVPPVDMKKLKAELAKNWLDKPEEVTEQILDAAQKIAASHVETIIAKRDEAEAVRVVKRLINQPEWKGLVTPENAIIVDAMASVAPGDTFAEKYEQALHTFAKEKNWKGAGVMVTTQPDQETEAMRAAAQAATAPNAASPVNKKKVYNRQWIQNLLITDPEKYRAMQPELMKAYSEGRVR